MGGHDGEHMAPVHIVNPDERLSLKMPDAEKASYCFHARMLSNGKVLAYVQADDMSHYMVEIDAENDCRARFFREF